jgi:TonB family protein
MAKGILIIIGGLVTMVGITVLHDFNGSGLEITNKTDRTDTISPAKDKAFNLQTVSFVPATNPAGEPFYDIRGNYKHAVNVTQLENATSLKDIVPHYPENWIEEYISTELSVSTAGESRMAVGKNAKLSSEQKALLKNVNPASKVAVRVNYLSKNAVTTLTDKNRMEVELTVVPEKEAKYPGGMEQLIASLKNNNNEKLRKESLTDLNLTTIFFAINKQGNVEDVRLTQSSGDKTVDNILLESIRNMPRWTPAEKNNGDTVKQEFEFTFGPPGC